MGGVTTAVLNHLASLVSLSYETADTADLPYLLYLIFDCYEVAVPLSIPCFTSLDRWFHQLGIGKYFILRMLAV